jgi:Putative esterase
MAASELQRSDGSHEEVPNVIHARRSERLRPVHFKGEQELRIDETVTPLIADHTIGPMIVVGIDSAHGEGRDYEYEAWKDPLTDGNQEEPDGKHLPSFFGSELVPFVSARYRVSDDTAHIGIGGTSVGLLLPYMSLSTVLICSGWCRPKARTFGWAMGNCCVIRLYFCERQIESQ